MDVANPISPPAAFTTAWWSAMGFVLLASLWLGGGHLLLRYWIDDPVLRFRAILVSDGVFVLLCATLLHALLRRLQRRQAQVETGKQARQLLSTLAEGSSDAIFAKDRDGVYLLANQATARLFGRSPDAIVGAGDGQVFPPEHVARIRADDLRVMEAEGNLTIEENIPTVDGVRIFLTTKGPLRNARGETYGLFGIARDITERATVLAKLESSERRYRLMFDVSPFPISVYDPESFQFLAVNQACIEQYGYSRDEFLTMTIMDIRPPEEVQRLEQRIQQDGELKPFDLGSRWTHRCKNGRLMQVEVESSDVIYEGRVARIAMARDVTAQVAVERERQKAQLEAVANRDLLRSVLERVEDGFVAFDTQWRYTYVNPQAARMLGRGNPDELLGSVIWEQFPDLVGHRLQQRFLQAMKDSEPCDFEGFYEPWRTWFEYRLYPSSEGLTVYFNDITERKRNEQLLLDQERSFRDLAEQMPALIYRAALDGSNKTLYVSQHVRLLGFTPEQWLADPTAWVRAVHPDDLARVVAALPTATSIFGEAQIEYRMRDGLGNWRHFRDSSRRVIPEDGGPAYLQGVSVDITDLIEAEEEIKYSEARLRASEQRYRLASAHGSVWDWDAESTLLFIGDEFWRQFGYVAVAAGDALFRFESLVHPDDVERRREMVFNHLRHRTPYDLEFRMRDAQGRWRWLHTQGQAVWDEAGRATYMAGTTVEITERVEARLALQASEARLRKSELRYRLAASHGSVWDGDLTTGHIHIADDFWRRLGHDPVPPEAMGARFRELIHPQDLIVRERTLREHLTRHTPYEVEFRIQDAAGNWRWIHSQGQAVWDDVGHATYMAGTSQDVTERVEATLALQASEVRLRKSELRYRLAASHGRVWDWDLTAERSDFGDELWVQLGYSGSPGVSSPVDLEQIMHPDDRALWKRTVREHIRDHRPYDLEFRVKDSQGSWRWLHSQGQAVWDDAGRATYMAGTTVEITERKEAQADLEASEAYRRQLFEQLSDGVLLVGSDHQILDANPQAWTMLGLSREALLGASLSDLLAEQELGRINRLSQTSSELAEWAFVRPDGSQFPAEVSTRPLDASRFLAVLRDISQRRHADRALLTYQLELSELTHQLLTQEKQTSQRMAQALHDRLGQTLAVTRLHLDALMTSVQNQIPSVLESQCETMDRLIEQAVHEVRDVLRELRPPLLEDMGLEAALDNEVNSPTWELAGADLLLEVDDDLGDPRWPADVEYGAFMVAREAITNALQHGQPSLIRVVLGGGVGELRLAVIDDGIGIPDAMVAGRPGHLGVVGMRERAIAIGGRFSMARGDSGGTTVSLLWKGS
jgi:PAS domain S-box-containing protein